MGALILYVAFGIVALGYYFQEYYDFFTIETDAENGIEDVQEDPGDGQSIAPDNSSHRKYNTEEGTAGAARDIDI